METTQGCHSNAPSRHSEIKMFTATYTKIQYTDGDTEYGAFVSGVGKYPKIIKAKAGDTVTVTTKNGETHERVIRRIVKDYASGVKVVFVKDDAIATKATQRYAATIATSKPAIAPKFNNGWCNICHSYCFGDCQTH